MRPVVAQQQKMNSSTWLSLDMFSSFQVKIGADLFLFEQGLFAVACAYIISCYCCALYYISVLLCVILNLSTNL